MRSDHPPPHGAAPTVTLRAKLERLLAKFPDPDAALDPLERLERAVAGVTIEAERLLASPLADARDRAIVRGKILQLLCWADSIDLTGQMAEFATRVAMFNAVPPRRPAPAQPTREPSPSWLHVRAVRACVAAWMRLTRK